MRVLQGRHAIALAAGVFALLLAACGTESGRVESANGEDGGSAPVVVGALPPPSPVRPPVLANYPKTIEDSKPNGAALYLYKQAQEARAGGRNDQAAALLQRALHVEPRNPFIWQSLAEAQLTLQQPDQAESAARKSSSLARGNPYVDAGNWRIIAAARQAQNDAQGALAAQAQADQAARAIGGDGH